MFLWLTVPLSTQEYKWVPSNCYTTTWENTGLVTHPRLGAKGSSNSLVPHAMETGISSRSRKLRNRWLSICDESTTSCHNCDNLGGVGRGPLVYLWFWLLVQTLSLVSISMQAGPSEIHKNQCTFKLNNKVSVFHIDIFNGDTSFLVF